MISLSLWFTDDPQPTLRETSFAHPLLAGDLRSVRGKTSGAQRNLGSFQWTPAVKALSFLLLNHLAEGRAEGAATSSTGFILSGEAGTLASTLDYALSKQPAWLLDMFGVDKHGTPIINRLIRRTNPERKRPGPVSLALQPQAPGTLRIKVFLGLRELSLATEILALAEQIRAATEGAPQRVSFPETDNSYLIELVEDLQSGWESQLKRIYLTECQEMLRQTVVFSPRLYRERLTEISEDSALEQISGHRLEVKGEYDLGLNSSQRLGLLAAGYGDRFFKNPGEPLRVAMPIGNAGALAIFTYLKEVCGLAIEIGPHFIFSPDLVRYVYDGTGKDQFDAFTLTLPSGARLISSAAEKTFTPFMLMPRVSHRIIAPKAAEQAGKLATGTFLVTSDPVTNAYWYFEDLRLRGELNKRKISFENQLPDEMTFTLRQGDPTTRAVLWFPHYQFNSLMNDCINVDKPTPDANKEMVMFVNNRLLAEKEKAFALSVVIRDAWLTLLQNPKELERTVDRILTERDYVKLLNRSVGMHNLMLEVDGLD